MVYQNILYRDGLCSQGAIPREPAYFADLNLDKIVQGILKDKTDSRLRELYYTPLANVEEILYRQDIMRDLEDAALRQPIRDFSERLLNIDNALREIHTKMQKKDVHPYKYLAMGRLLAKYKEYIDIVLTLQAVLNKSSFRSQGMQAFAVYIAQYANSSAFRAFLEETRSVRAEMASIRFNMLISGGSVKVREYEKEPDHNVEIQRLFSKFKQGEAECPDAKPDPRAYQDFVEEHILGLLKKHRPESFAHLETYCKTYQDSIDGKLLEFSRDVRFYLSYLDYIGILKLRGLPFCYPELCTETKDIESRQGFDIALAHQLMQSGETVVSNDFSLSGEERIMIVSGPNQGGKTTFARAFGQMHFLASIGCCVQGSKARLFLPDSIYTHFEREENHDTLTGKLQDDLLRFQQILTSATDKSIIIINEMLSSTSLKDAVFIGKRFMDKIISLGSICVYVTFLTELASYTEHTVSMVSEVLSGDPTQRTFRLSRQQANGLAYATHIASKYGLTYERVKERIKL